jgi:hypothetical protein
MSNTITDFAQNKHCILLLKKYLISHSALIFLSVNALNFFIKFIEVQMSVHVLLCQLNALNYTDEFCIHFKYNNDTGMIM